MAFIRTQLGGTKSECHVKNYHICAKLEARNHAKVGELEEETAAL